MILLIDHFDSFAHNLARYFTLCNQTVEVLRYHDQILKDIEALAPRALILSPGPCSPDEVPVSLQAVQKWGEHMPIFGVCLGHQIIAQAYNQNVKHSTDPRHGRSSEIIHTGHPLFKGVSNPFTAGRYHSLDIDPAAFQGFTVIAKTQDHQIMAIAHSSHPVYGVQFHPESILTPEGQTIVQNFITLATAFWDNKAEAEPGAPSIPIKVKS